MFISHISSGFVLFFFLIVCLFHLYNVFCICPLCILSCKQYLYFYIVLLPYLICLPSFMYGHKPQCVLPHFVTPWILLFEWFEDLTYLALTNLSLIFSGLIKAISGGFRIYFGQIVIHTGAEGDFWLVGAAKTDVYIFICWICVVQG